MDVQQSHLAKEKLSNLCKYGLKVRTNLISHKLGGKISAHVTAFNQWRN